MSDHRDHHYHQHHRSQFNPQPPPEPYASGFDHHDAHQSRAGAPASPRSPRTLSPDNIMNGYMGSFAQIVNGASVSPPPSAPPSLPPTPSHMNHRYAIHNHELFQELLRARASRVHLSQDEMNAIYNTNYPPPRKTPAELKEERLAQAKLAARPGPRLARYSRNPILKPVAAHAWESMTTFNPAAVEIDGVTHILYRAQGFDYVSRFGYMRSRDGFTVDYKSPMPVFEDRTLGEMARAGTARDYGSGGSLGGSEDPRATLFEGVVYVFYVAYDGCSPPHLAMVSIAKDDLVRNDWSKWSTPQRASQFGIVDKSGALFPERVNGGKVCILHRIFPDIQIDYRDEVDFSGGDLLQIHARIKASKEGWDSRKIGTGAPPLKTKDGWLVLTYGVDDRPGHDGRYCLGAMLLDLEDPSIVLSRSLTPILEPKAPYETTTSAFKANILYVCGAVIKNDRLIAYYGAADTFVCAASADLDEFLALLKKDRPVVDVEGNPLTVTAAEPVASLGVVTAASAANKAAARTDGAPTTAVVDEAASVARTVRGGAPPHVEGSPTPRPLLAAPA